MTTWDGFVKCVELMQLCEEKGFKIDRVQFYDGGLCHTLPESQFRAIRGDSDMHPEFVENNCLKIAESVEEALAWIQGFCSVTWSRKLNL